MSDTFSLRGKYDRRLADRLIGKVKRAACADPVTCRAVDGGAEIRYPYRGGRGLSLFTIEIDRFVCAGIS